MSRNWKLTVSPDKIALQFSIAESLRHIIYAAIDKLPPYYIKVRKDRIHSLITKEMTIRMM